MKIKEKLKSIFQISKKSFEKFPVTIITILLFSAFSAIVIDTELIKEEVWQNIMFFVLYFASGTLFIESLFHEKDKKKIVLYAISAVISIVLVTMQNNEFINNVLWKISICYVLTLWILSVYFLFRKSNRAFKEYILKVFVNIIKTSIIYGILSIGIAIVSSIFVYLIWEKLGYTLVLRLEIILLGFYYIPKLIYCLVDVKEEVDALFKGLIKYVLTSLVIISFIIIYMYIIKILIFRDMPKNQIFRILSALFIVGMPIWTMMQYFKDESFLYKVSLKLPIAFIPFIFLQIYTIGIRIADNGITPLRYVCIALILFEIAYILIYILKKEKLEILLLVFNAIIIISLIVPGINMFKISDISQAQNLKIYIKKSDYTDEDKDKIYGAYIYLNNSENGEKYINEILNDEDIEKIKSFKVSKVNTYNSEIVKYIQSHKNDDKIEVTGYSNLYFITASNRSNNSNIENTFNNVELQYQNSDETINADLSGKFEKYIKTYIDLGDNELDEYFKNHNEIEIDNDKKLIIKSFYLNYNQEAKLVKNYSIKGYLLEK